MSSLTLPEPGSVPSFNDVMAEYEDATEFVQLHMHFPNGTTDTLSLLLGATVMQAKRMLIDAHDIPYSDSTLFLNNTQLMIDPLSFNDFPSILADRSADIHVRIKDPSHPLNQPAQQSSTLPSTQQKYVDQPSPLRDAPSSSESSPLTALQNDDDQPPTLVGSTTTHQLQPKSEDPSPTRKIPTTIDDKDSPADSDGDAHRSDSPIKTLPSSSSDQSCKCILL